LALYPRGTAAAHPRAVAERNVAAWRGTQEKWAGEVKADPDIGGPRLTVSVAAAACAIEWPFNDACASPFDAGV